MGRKQLRELVEDGQRDWRGYLRAARKWLDIQGTARANPRVQLRSDPSGSSELPKGLSARNSFLLDLTLARGDLDSETSGPSV
jgi:hypothetical protein